MTSLPGSLGIGDLGPSAHNFVEFLASAGQRWWQMLPMGPRGDGNSPYKASSVFAGNPLLISPESLVEDRLLRSDEIVPPANFAAQRVLYGEAARFKGRLFKKAHERFETGSSAREREQFEKFRSLNKNWLRDHALFAALKAAYRGAPWPRWDPGLQSRKRDALAAAAKSLASGIRYHEFLQYVFFKQWKKLKKASAAKGIGLIGDVPIYVDQESADVWVNQDLFELDKTGRPPAVAGVPPDFFNKKGQLWGNPLYRWDVLRRRGYSWWISRLGRTFERFDAVRLDHFIGFRRYYRVPAGARTAENGHWIEGPGAHFFERVLGALGDRQIIAEDLGLMGPDVVELRDRFHFPGIKVLQFAFGTDLLSNEYLPHNYPRDCVVYTGTHDNDTIVGWFSDPGGRGSARTRKQVERDRASALHYLGTDGREIHWDMMRLALSSVANTAIIPAQDLLGLGSEARMNRPGTRWGNWEWRLQEGVLDERICERLRNLTETCGRIRLP